MARSAERQSGVANGRAADYCLIPMADEGDVVGHASNDLTIFISYRRADTRADAGRLYDALRRRFGKDQLFMDVDTLQPGQDWVSAVEDAVARCDVLLALI